MHKCDCNWHMNEVYHIWFLGISRYKLNVRFWFNLNLYRGIWVPAAVNSESYITCAYVFQVHSSSECVAVCCSVLQLYHVCLCLSSALIHMPWADECTWWVHLTCAYVFQVHSSTCGWVHRSRRRQTLQHTATHCNTLQHTPLTEETDSATHCNTLQHTATHCNTLRSRRRQTVQHTATHRNTLQHTATHSAHGGDRL